MTTVDIVLPSTNQSYTLPKEYIRTYLPESILATALQDDPGATRIDLPNPLVTPETMALLVRLSQGQEPDKPNPHLIEVDRYLNTPGLLYYADPLYEEIRQGIPGLVDRILQDDRVWALGYLLIKGWQPSKTHLNIAAKSGAANSLRLLLPRVAPDTETLLAAIRSKDVPSVKLILAHPAVDATAFSHAALRLAAHLGLPEVVQLLLANPQVDPQAKFSEALRSAVVLGHVEVVRILLADPRSNPQIADEIFLSAIEHYNPAMIRTILDNPTWRQVLLSRIEGVKYVFRRVPRPSAQGESLASIVESYPDLRRALTPRH